ncbi:hypothetical protein F4779DRAFT_16824 [Xylariaceae sp. FL0662B]|nr:hypothetical protein F4779DRAFT_16824 [Xylariaceae sp. FL0662B]
MCLRRSSPRPKPNQLLMAPNKQQPKTQLPVNLPLLMHQLERRRQRRYLSHLGKMGPGLAMNLPLRMSSQLIRHLSLNLRVKRLRMTLQQSRQNLEHRPRRLTKNLSRLMKRPRRLKDRTRRSPSSQLTAQLPTNLQRQMVMQRNHPKSNASLLSKLSLLRRNQRLMIAQNPKKLPRRAHHPRRRKPMLLLKQPLLNQRRPREQNREKAIAPKLTRRRYPIQLKFQRSPNMLNRLPATVNLRPRKRHRVRI